MEEKMNYMCTFVLLFCFDRKNISANIKGWNTLGHPSSLRFRVTVASLQC